MQNEIKNHGLIIDKIEPENYILGGAGDSAKVADDILRERGNNLATTKLVVIK